MGRFATLEPPEKKSRFSAEVLAESRFSQEVLDVQPEPTTQAEGLRPATKTPEGFTLDFAQDIEEEQFSFSDNSIQPFDPAEAPAQDETFKAGVVERAAVQIARDIGITSLLPLREAGIAGGAAVPSPDELAQTTIFKKLPEIIGTTSLIIGKFAAAHGLFKAIGFLQALPKSASVITKATETAKLFLGIEAIEQVTKANFNKITDEDLPYEGWGMIFSLALQGTGKVGRALWAKLKPTEQQWALKQLGLKKGATIEEINKASREFSKKFHPDKVKGFREDFEQIIKARDILRKGPVEDIVKARVKPKLIPGEIKPPTAITPQPTVPIKAVAKPIEPPVTPEAKIEAEKRPEKVEIERKPLAEKAVTAEKVQEAKIETFKKGLERNIAKSPYKDLVEISEGVYKGKNVNKQVSRDAEKLFDAVFEGNIETIKEILPKYEKEFLASQKKGQTRDRFIPVDNSKVRIFELATKAINDFGKIQQPPAPKAAELQEAEVKRSDATLLDKRSELLSIDEARRNPQQIREIEDIENELINRHIDDLPEQDIGEKTRKKEIKNISKQIRDHDIYASTLQEFTETLPDLGGTFLVDKKEIIDVQQQFEGKPKVLARFTTDPKKGIQWDSKAQERGIESFNEFLDAVELNTEIGIETTRINQFVLDSAVGSGNPELTLLSHKLEMLKDGFSAEEINEMIVDFAEFEGIDPKELESEFIKVEVISDVETKQRILREIEKKNRKVTARAPEPKRKAISQAKERAFKLKRDLFITEKAGRFSISVNPPKTGEFIRVSPPAKGELRQITTEEVAGPTPEETKELKSLRRQINIIKTKKGLTNKQFNDIKRRRAGKLRLTRMDLEELKAVLDGMKRSRPKIIRHKTVITRKTEKEITELKTSLTDLGFMSDVEFQKILDTEVRGKEAKFIDRREFVTQKEGREILNRMHDTAQKLRVTEPVRKAVEKRPDIQKELAKIEKLPKRTKDPGRLRSMRFFYQIMGLQADQPIYDVYLDMTLEGQARSRERHRSTKLAEKLPDFAKIANDPKALQRVEDWIVSKSVLEDKPDFPEDITENEVRLAKLVQASFKAYETVARAGKFFEFFDNRTEIPQYLKFKQGIDKAFDIFNTKGHDALIKYLDTQDWGIVSAGYSPMESVVKKVSTHRMPDIAVGKGRIRQRGITYRKQDRDILQRWYSYMRQMDQLIHIQPRIKSLVRLVNDSQGSFVNPGKINSVVSTYLDNLKHTNYEDGLIEEWSRRLYSQAITVRVLADPLKPLRNLLQNAAFSEDRKDLFDPRNKKLTPEDLEYLETHVQQSSVMMTDWAFVGEDPILFKNLTKWVQRKTLYPSSDRLNRLISFHAKINRVRRGFAKDQSLAKKMIDARFSDMQREEQRMALGILAKDGINPMARYIAKVHTDNTHFLYAREQRSPAEQTKLGRIALNLALFRRAAVEKALLQLGKVFQRRTGFRAKVRAANVLVTLLGMSTLVGLLYKKFTGQKYSPYSYLSFLELNFGGLAVATIEKIENVYNSLLAIATLDPKKAGKAIDDFGADLAAAADYMIPFYDLSIRAVEATIGSENIERIPFKKIRELIDKEFKSRGLKQIDRSLIEKIQSTFARGGPRKQKKDTSKLD